MAQNFAALAEAELRQAKSVQEWNAIRENLVVTAGYTDKEKREALAAIDARGLIVEVLGKDS